MLTQHTCDVYRNTAVGTNGRKAKTLHASGLACTFIPMSARAALSNGFTLGKGYDVFFNDGADVLVGDQLKRDTQSYIVSAVMPYTGFGDVSHVQILANLEVR